MFKNLSNNELVEYICNVCNRIISHNFSISTVVNANEAKMFLNEERIKEVLLYKENKCSIPKNESEEVILNEYKASCKNCLTRRDCFTSSNEICDDYRPSPTRVPDYWPKEMRGPY